MSDKKPQPMNTEYRPLANPKNFEQFLSGGGVLSNRQEIADQFGYDWHARKLKFESHIRGHVLMQATAYKSARDHQWAASHDKMFAANGAGVEIGVSGLTQANQNRPIEPYVLLMQQVLDAVADLPHRRLRQLDKETWQGITGLLGQVDLFDATSLSLPPKLAAWSANVGPGEGGALKLQLKMAGESGKIKQIMLTPATGNDTPYTDDLLGDLQQQTGRIFVFDAGYGLIDSFAAIVESDNHFVTKLPGYIHPTLIEERPVPDTALSSGYTVVKDALVYLGDDPSVQVRLLEVELTSGKSITLLTSFLDKSADQICLLYRYRWTIEIVFRWLKQLLQLDHLMSHDPTGILRQILTALIVWGLLVISHHAQQTFSPKQLWRQLYADLHQAIFEAGVRHGLALAQDS